MSKLFKIEMKFYKGFYVEANSQDEALAMDCVEDQQGWHGRKPELEHDETTAVEVTATPLNCGVCASTSLGVS
jgi:hypothetical protein